jgi:hypothetical protein
MIIGEVRSEECLDWLLALNAGLLDPSDGVVAIDDAFRTSKNSSTIDRTSGLACDTTRASTHVISSDRGIHYASRVAREQPAAFSRLGHDRVFTSLG